MQMNPPHTHLTCILNAELNDDYADDTIVLPALFYFVCVCFQNSFPFFPFFLFVCLFVFCFGLFEWKEVEVLELIEAGRNSGTETTGVNVCDRRRPQVTWTRRRRRRVQARADISASTLISNKASFTPFLFLLLFIN